MIPDEIKYWKWKTSIIDFSKLPRDKLYEYEQSKSDYIFRFLPLPYDCDEIYEWYNGGWSTEFNEALRYAIELGLAEWIKEEDE